MGSSYVELKTRIEKIGTVESLLNVPIFVNDKAVGAVIKVEELEEEFELSIVVFNVKMGYERNESNITEITALHLDSVSVSEI